MILSGYSGTLVSTDSTEERRAQFDYEGFADASFIEELEKFPDHSPSGDNYIFSRRWRKSSGTGWYGHSIEYNFAPGLPENTCYEDHAQYVDDSGVERRIHSIIVQHNGGVTNASAGYRIPLFYLKDWTGLNGQQRLICNMKTGAGAFELIDLPLTFYRKDGNGGGALDDWDGSYFVRAWMPGAGGGTFATLGITNTFEYDFSQPLAIAGTKVLDVQQAAIPDLTVTATSGSLPTVNGSVTIADAATPTAVELLEYCRELETKLEAALVAMRAHGLIAT